MFGETSLVIVLLVTSLLVNLITMVLVIVVFKKNKSGPGSSQKQVSCSEQAAATVSGIVFCRACGNQYDSTSSACPICKTAR